MYDTSELFSLQSLLLKLTSMQPSEFNKLNAIHIAGTKGKGSTSAFISSILTQFIGTESATMGKTLSKIGLYTSPHLRFVRERIQLNGEPLTEEQFAKYFFETWDRLEASAVENGQDPASPGTKPVYFRYLTLMAFHTYMSEGVDCAVIECGIGGAYDSTNVLQAPSVTGITSLAIDHVGVLGNTLPEIAWHKAGVMKPGAKCYTTTSQLPEAKAVLEKVADDVNVDLCYVEVLPEIASGEVRLGLEADFQKINASLAQEIAKDWLSKHGYGTTAERESKCRVGLSKVKWSGRCETRQEGDLTWYIDGGHTLESIRLAGQWYAGIQQDNISTNTQAHNGTNRVLIFNQQTRDAGALATALHEVLAATLRDAQPFTHAIFCTNETFQEAGFRPDLVSANTNSDDIDTLKVQKALAETWKKIDSATKVTVVKTIEEAVNLARQTAAGQKASVLVTGSLHLVGGFLEVLETGNTT